MSLKGRWIALARKWLEQNCPCSVDDYYMQVTSLMPTHINAFRQKPDVKLSLAKSALTRLSKNQKRYKAVVAIQEGQVVLLPSATTQSKYRFDQRFPQISESGPVDAASMELTKKELNALREYLRTRGYTRTGYRKWEKISNDIQTTTRQARNV
jgi:hypothetical protein